ncbi:fructose-specific PTS transporter subunit EIIC [Spiroplasma endosymbiont of Aspidapion aeneum]|uniref:PTS fructose transporter subunit IIABC n=1 Tax=Spiroplasma endosymbiont of Aspidapion aeneum TaxID=3066276 RepID=UPI00313D0C46
MELKDLFKNGICVFDQIFETKEELFYYLSKKLLDNNYIESEKEFLKAIKKREESGSTAMEMGIAMPHALSKTVKETVIAFASLKKPINSWRTVADDKPVDLVFMIATNGENGGEEHLKALSSLSSVLIKKENVDKIRLSKNYEGLIKVLASKSKKNNEKIISNNGFYDVVGVTACATGIAHTYLAQEKLEEYAKELGLTVKIETQGRRGTENRLNQDDIDNAKIIILAHEKSISNSGRFSGKELIDTTSQEAIYKGKDLIMNFNNHPKKITYKSRASDNEDDVEFSFKKFKDIKGNLLAGVSRMLPFVVGGGIILGIAFLCDMGTTGDGTFGTHRQVSAWFAAIGKTGLSMMVPILAGFIAYALVGIQGLMPGMIAGLFSSSIMPFAYGSPGGWSNMWDIIPGVTHVESGFVGGIFGGYIAGLYVMLLTRWFSNFSKAFTGARDIVFIPVVSLLAISVTMFIINIPLGYLMGSISKGLQWMANKKLLPIVAAIIGLMMCFDMGGPINKIAYTLGTLSVGKTLITDQSSGIYEDQTIIMAASLFAGMMPPLMIAISTLIFPNVWSTKERDAAKANWIMGCCFITEGAIPFMINDAKRVGICSMIGGLFIGIFVGFFGIKVGAPHGGILVFALISLGKSGVVDLGITGSGVQLGVGIALSLLILFGMATISGTILGIWRKIDIKNGKLIVPGLELKDKTPKLKIKIDNNEEIRKLNK